ncbi:MAG: type II secretion system minor pseudopilin GspI [Candidatus Aureabacteria bacterium]|nr:type II secretion system minor pseudopilin GspI [Candidatus Auribacterota bacterium]
MNTRIKRNFPSHRPRCGTHRGFTLVEVMVALVIISIGMVTLLSTHVISTRTYAEAKATTVCSLLAQQKLAELQAGELPPPGETSGGFEDNEHYQWTLSVRETELEALREVTLEVSLRPPEEIEETEGMPKVTVTTSLADLGKPEEEEEGEQEKG